ncbi:hypothetical protein ABKV19_002508 [Rosa sericea]
MWSEFGLMGTILSRFLLLWWVWRTGQPAEHHFIDDCGSLCQNLRAKYELWMSFERIHARLAVPLSC